jgi:hypothetical protein
MSVVKRTRNVVLEEDYFFVVYYDEKEARVQVKWVLIL